MELELVQIAARGLAQPSHPHVNSDRYNTLVSINLCEFPVMYLNSTVVVTMNIFPMSTMRSTNPHQRTDNYREEEREKARR